MDKITRKKSVITQKDNLEHLYTFKDLSQGVTVVPISKDICDKLCNEIDKFDFECL